MRTGTAPEVIRRKGAEGSLPVALEEKIEILIFLCSDDDATIRDTAFKTLQSCSSDDIRPLLSNPATPLPILDFAVGYLVPGRADLQEALLQNSQLPGDLREWLQSLTIRPDSFNTPPASPIPIIDEEGVRDATRETLLQRIARMSTAEKIKVALTGSQEERLLLIRDSNKVVARAVLQSPKLSDQEIESVASMKNVPEEVLRLIATNRKFMKSYPVVHALVNNPRAPLDATMHVVNRMNDRDLKGLSINKNVPDTLRTMALKLIKQKTDAHKH